jgi:hypothetical protein
MKVASIALFTSLIASADAVGFRDLVERVSHRNTKSAAAADTATAIEGADQENRELQQAGCWGNTGTQVKKWHPTYSAGWTNGYCRYTVDCNSPSYSTELACCKGAYAGQMSGECLMQLPSPPTMSPTQTGGLDVYYPDYSKAWPLGSCINARPLPSGRPNYSTMLACCKAAYGGQISGTCLSELPSPPTGSPSTSDFEAAFWYPDYDTAWSVAGCSNKLPLPFNNPNDRPNYSTQVACCKAAYAGQMSGTCLSELPSPPTTSPTGTGGAGFWYPDYETAWSIAGCSNDRPVPFKTGGRPTYATMLACCKGAYGGQSTGACLAALPNPPTTSPTDSGGLDGVFYPDYGRAWPMGLCISDRPLPSGRPSYSSKSACCQGAYGGQSSHTCQCDIDVCYSCKCGNDAERLAASCDIDCD